MFGAGPGLEGFPVDGGWCGDGNLIAWRLVFTVTARTDDTGVGVGVGYGPPSEMIGDKTLPGTISLGAFV